MTTEAIENEALPMQGKYTLKIAFDRPLTPNVLIDVLWGLNNLVDPTNYILDGLCDHKGAKINNIAIEEIKEGSILVSIIADASSSIGEIKAAVEAGTELCKQAKDKTWDQILAFTIPTGLYLFGREWLKTKQKSGINVTTQGNNSPIILSGNKEIVDAIKELVPGVSEDNLKQLTEKVASSVDEMESKRPRSYSKGKKAAIELSHPGGEASKGISFGYTAQLDRGENLPIVMGEETISQLPSKYMPPTKEDPKKQTKILRNVRIKPVLTDTEGGARWTARLEQEGETFKELSFHIDDEEKRNMIYYLLPQSFYADIEVELIIKGNGDSEYLFYIFKDFADDTKSILRKNGFNL